jgi:hypothetical protein
VAIVAKKKTAPEAPTHADAFDFYRTLARVSLPTPETRELRSFAMQAFLEDASERMKDRTIDARTAKIVDRLWKAYRPRPEGYGGSVRRLARIVDAASQAHETLSAAHAVVLFAQLVYQGLPPANALLLSDRVKALVGELTPVWRRSAGAPTTAEKNAGRRPKWEVFADLHEAIGLGPVDPDDVKRECAPSRKVKGRKLRH